jgi:general secretion pathway protein N
MRRPATGIPLALAGAPPPDALALTMRRLAIFTALVLAFTLAGLPATLMDSVIARATDGRLRLASAQGTLWRGHGMLAIADRQRRLIAVRPLDWRIGLDWGSAAVTLQVGEAGHVQARLLVSAREARVDRVHLELPLSIVSAAVPHPAARAGWHGALVLDSAAFACTWQRSCDGTLRVRWHDAALDIVPERHLGDHEVVLHGRGPVIDVDLRTLAGAPSIDGHGKIGLDGSATLQATISGDPELVDRMPSIMDGKVRPTGTPGRAMLSLP